MRRIPVIDMHCDTIALIRSRNVQAENLKSGRKAAGTGYSFSVTEEELASGIDLRKNSRISDMIRHIQHIKNVAGIETIGLGSDFDGISGNLEISGAGQIQKLAQALEVAGFTEEEIEKIYYKNVLRVYKEVLG